jgi:glutamate-5-semialdehyde dehydrogenase
MKPAEIEAKLTSVRRAARELRKAPATTRTKVLTSLGGLLKQNVPRILAANQKDLMNLPSTATAAFRDRLTLNSERIDLMAKSLAQVGELPDPLGEVTEKRSLPNGLLLKKVRAPFGVILMIFEARPNVVTEAFSLALKSSNALILRGGSESLQSCMVLYELIGQAIASAGLPPAVFWGVIDASRDLSQALMKQDQYIDVLVPRGGDSLIAYVKANATMPIIKNDRGLCHVYVHEDANDDMAVEIVFNAKTSRPGVCNSMETLLLHEKKKNLLPRIFERLSSAKVEWFGCPETLKILGSKAKPATGENFNTEYLDMKLNCRVVKSFDEALDHIETYGSRHSEAIVTATESVAREFQDSVDAAAVYWNASTRFTDGFEFGLGGELGISTQKLHVRGPVGLRELTSLRWVIDGAGQVR